MTGLNPETDTVLQVCCFITDSNLTLLDPTGYEAIIHHPSSALSSMSEWCISTHGASGLSAAVLASTTSAQDAARNLLAYIQRYVPRAKTALLAGNSVHADKMFLAREPWSEVLGYLHYRILDVSAVKEGVRRWCGDEVLGEVPRKKGLHLAREDVLESIEEMRFYRDRVFRRC